jgi:DNA-binding MarR family transcriptional regulator
VASTAPFDDGELAAWHGMLRTHALVIRELDERLARRHGLAISEFDVLITLANASGHELRMTEMADAVMLSPSGLTRLVGRLEREGLVRRRPSNEDGRSFLASLTDDGAAKLDEARPTHNAIIRELFLDRVSMRDRAALARAWRTVHEQDGSIR